MKSYIAVLAAALCALAGVPGIHAETNLVQSLNIDLTAIGEGVGGTVGGVATETVTNSHITSATVISALGTSLGTTFSKKARLLLAPDSSSFTVTIEDGTNTPVDVSAHFVFSASSNSVQSVSYKTNTTVLITNIYGLETITLQNVSGAAALPFTFSVSGLADVAYDGTDSGGTVTENGFTLMATVAGEGEYGGEFAVFSGTVGMAGCGPEPGGQPPRMEFSGQGRR